MPNVESCLHPKMEDTALALFFPFSFQVLSSAFLNSGEDCKSHLYPGPSISSFPSPQLFFLSFFGTESSGITECKERGATFPRLTKPTLLAQSLT